MESDWLTLATLVIFIFLTFFQFSGIFFYSAFPRAVSHSLLVFLLFVTLSCTVMPHRTRISLEQSSKHLSRILGIKTKRWMLIAWALTPSDFSKISVTALGHGGVGILFCSSLVHPQLLKGTWPWVSPVAAQLFPGGRNKCFLSQNILNNFLSPPGGRNKCFLSQNMLNNVKSIWSFWNWSFHPKDIFLIEKSYESLNIIKLGTIISL